jgi:hypothetical protein
MNVDKQSAFCKLKNYFTETRIQFFYRKERKEVMHNFSALAHSF